MKPCNLASALVVCVVMSFGAIPAGAVPITYQFGVTAIDGPLAGTTSLGTFTFDTSIIPSGGGFVSIAGLFTQLAFAWQGFNYDETTANTGTLGFEADGTLIYALFGTDCGPSGFGCGVGPDLDQWSFDIYYGAGAFYYRSPADPIAIFTGTTALTGPVSIAAPGTLPLLCLALAALAFLRRSHRVTRWPRPNHAVNTDRHQRAFARAWRPVTLIR
jgi:hypothetical protein